MIRDTTVVAVAKGFKPDRNGYMSLPEAHEFCASHNWKVHTKRQTRRKIYDLFMLNGELDWLEIRLNELKDYVDYFVVLESATTFTDLPRPLHLQENWEKFSQFHDQIIYHVVNKTGFSSDRAWDHEDLQRNAMFDQVFPGLVGTPRQAVEKDVIIVSDVDEIPRPAALTVLRNCAYPRRLTLHSRFYYYSFQWLHRGDEWAHPQATFYEGDNTIRPANLRNGEGGNILRTRLDKADLWNAGWHCSSCFATVDEMLNKMSSFSHQGWNQPEYREREGIVRRVRNGLDLFDRTGEYYDKIDSNPDVPEYMKRNKEKFSYILDRDPENANFRDYKVDEAVTE